MAEVDIEVLCLATSIHTIVQVGIMLDNRQM